MRCHNFCMLMRQKKCANAQKMNTFFYKLDRRIFPLNYTRYVGTPFLKFQVIIFCQQPIFLTEIVTGTIFDKKCIALRLTFLPT